MSVIDVHSSTVDFDLPGSYHNRQFEIGTLPNGLRCLFIDDPDTTMLAAAMLIGVGNGSDPPETPGLAHLCEHMLYLGSKEFPEPGYLHSVTTAAGGYTNAYTTGVQTCFHFELSAKAHVHSNKELAGTHALQVFASLFKNPLFKEKQIKEEIKAVDEEHRINLSDDEKLLYQALRILTRPSHPFSHFGLGNKKTLSKCSIKLIQLQLQEFFKSQYVAPNMTLVLKGPQSINHLKKLALMYFSGITERPKRPTSLDIYRKLTPVNKSELFPKPKKALLIKHDTIPKLRLCYPLKPMKWDPNYSRVCNFICNLLGDESLGSLCELLKRKKQWATSIMVSVQPTILDEDLLLIDLILTKLGANHFANVINTIQYYVNEFVLKCDTPSMEYLIDKYDFVESFRFYHQKPDSSPCAEICHLGEVISQGLCDFEYLVRGINPWVLNKSSSRSLNIKKCLSSCISSKRLTFILLSPTIKIQRFCDESTLQRDEHFLFEYLCLPVNHSITFEPPAEAQILKLPQTLSDSEKPEESEVHPKIKQTMRYACPSQKYKKSVEYPTLIYFTDFCQLWSHSCTQAFLDLEGNSIITIHISFESLKPEVYNIVGLDILAEIIGEELKYRLYHQELFGVFWGIFVNINTTPSIMLSCSGHKKCLSYIVKQTSEVMKEVIDSMSLITYSTFKKARTAVRKNYEEMQNSVSIKKTVSASYFLLDEGAILPTERIEALELIDAEYLENLTNSITNSTNRLSCLSTEDFAEEELQSLKNSFENSFQATQKEATKIDFYAEDLTSFVLPAGRNMFLSVNGSQEDPINTVLYYIQLGRREDKAAYTKAKITEAFLAKSALECLRNKKNLSYIVFTNLRIFRKTFGIHILVPSSEFDCEYLTNEIEEYLLAQEAILEQMTETIFEEAVKNPILQSLREQFLGSKIPTSSFASLQPKQGSGERPDSFDYNVHWSHFEQIISGELRFGSTECEEPIDENMIKDIKLRDFKDFFNKFVRVSSESRSSLTIANKAGELRESHKLNILAQELQHQLENHGLLIDTDKAYEVLRNCEDQENFKDVSNELKRYFGNTNQGIKFKKFAIKSLAGSFLKNTILFSRLRSRKTVPSLKRLGTKRHLISDFKDLHLQCTKAPASNLLQKRVNLEIYSELELYIT